MFLKKALCLCLWGWDNSIAGALSHTRVISGTVPIIVPGPKALQTHKISYGHSK